MTTEESREMTNERPCATCGYARSSAEHDGFETDIIRDVLLPGPRHPFKAAPSADEGEARVWHENMPPSWSGAKRWVYGNGTVGVVVNDDLEAAIRAPLEERIREMEDELEALKNTPGYKLAESWQRDYGVVFKENQELKSEVERLREALRRIRAMASPQGWDFGDAAIVREVDAALATPPSSTEGDGTQVPD